MTTEDTSDEPQENPGRLTPEDLFNCLWLLLQNTGPAAIPFASVEAIPKDAEIQAIPDPLGESILLVPVTKEKRKRGIIRPKKKILVPGDPSQN